MKEYKTNEQLIDYLISKNVIINNREDALKKLERYSYYSIINTYKELFKEGKNYKKNVTFDEIYAIYEFDKNLKAIFLKYVLEIELIIKSLIANFISKKYGLENYLNKDNFQNIDEDLIQVLLSQIDDEVKKNYSKHLAITHYVDKYGFIPPFVLVKILTFGLISRYYGLLKQEDRQAISKYFKLSDKVLKQILLNLTMIRNISAHSDRLYSFHSKFFISFKEIDRSYHKKEDSTNLYMIMKCMEKLLDDEKNIRFEIDLQNEINLLSIKLKSINISDVLNIMGFPNA